MQRWALPPAQYHPCVSAARQGSHSNAHCAVLKLLLGWHRGLHCPQAACDFPGPALPVVLGSALWSLCVRLCPGPRRAPRAQGRLGSSTVLHFVYGAFKAPFRAAFSLGPALAIWRPLPRKRRVGLCACWRPCSPPGTLRGHTAGTDRGPWGLTWLLSVLDPHRWNAFVAFESVESRLHPTPLKVTFLKTNTQTSVVRVGLCCEPGTGLGSAAVRLPGLRGPRRACPFSRLWAGRGAGRS